MWTKRPSYYVLLPDHSIKPCELMEWARGLEARDGQHWARVASDEVMGSQVSTVFLGLDHNFWEGPPIVFETMVFGGPMDKEMDRYSTWDEAVEGHAAMVERVKRRMEN